MGKYTENKSKYIHNLIKGSSWDNHGYVDELIQLNEYINNHPTQWASSVHYRLLREKYQNEYLELLKENSIERYEKELKRIQEEKKEAIDYEKKQMNELKILMDDWIKAGGSK